MDPLVVTGIMLVRLRPHRPAACPAEVFEGPSGDQHPATEEVPA
jgi:hypothetical protein